MDVLLMPFRWIYRGAVWLANSPKTLILSYGALIVICGALYYVFEGGSTLGDSIWWAIVTASTVGYGDISPKTWEARVLAGLLISLMVLVVIPLITAQFASKLIVDHDAFQHEEQEELKENLRRVRLLLEALAEREGVAVAAREGVAEPESRAGGEGVAEPGSHAEPGSRAGRQGVAEPGSRAGREGVAEPEGLAGREVALADQRGVTSAGSATPPAAPSDR